MLVNMSKINFRGSSSQGHVIYKVNFKVKCKAKGQYVLLFSKRREMTDLDSLSSYLSNNIITLKIGFMVPEIHGLKVSDHDPFWRNMKFLGSCNF